MSIERSAHRKGDNRYVRRSVSLPPDIAERVDEEVGDRAFSSFVADAIDRELRFRAMDQWLADYEAERGPINKERVGEIIAQWYDEE